MKLKLVRCIDFKQNGIGGVMIQTDGSFHCLTLELPWRDNKRDISCIPVGKYTLELTSSKFGVVPEVKAVSGRSAILIHSGNTVNDTNGCILVGKKFGILNAKDAVLNSRSAMAELLLAFDNNYKAEIEIVSLI